MAPGLQNDLPRATAAIASIDGGGSSFSPWENAGLRRNPAASVANATPPFDGGIDSLPALAPGTEANSGRVLVLGLGNDILCDDAIGLRVVREVRQQLASDEAIDVQETEEMGLCLLDYISGCRDLVLVDAIQRGGIPAGTAHEIEADDLQRLPGSSPHFLGVGETLALGRQLGLPMPARVRIVAIEVEEPHLLSTEMTPTLQRALPGLAQRVLALARGLAQAKPVLRGGQEGRPLEAPGRGKP